MVQRADDISSFTNEAILCRSFGHAWKAYTATEGHKLAKKKKTKGYNVTLVCDHGCGTFKHFFLSERGEYHSPHYSYDDGYLASFKITQADREYMRLQALQAMIQNMVELKRAEVKI